MFFTAQTFTRAKIKWMQEAIDFLAETLEKMKKWADKG